MRYDLNVNGIKGVQDELNKYSKSVEKGLKHEVATVSYKVQSSARKAAPVHQGGLRRSIIALVKGLTSIVYTDSEYALDVEKGQKPGSWANVEDLKFWVRKKIRPDNKRLNSVTFLVNRKIFKEGTDAQPYFEPAVNKWKKRFINNVTKIIKRG